MQILATEATLSTLKVEIKTLTVSAEQMTLSFFCQLPRAGRAQHGVEFFMKQMNGKTPKEGLHSSPYICSCATGRCQNPEYGEGEMK